MSMDNILASLRSKWDLSQRGPMSRAPLYHQLYSVLKAAILDGTIPYDSQMPTEQQLAATFDVSRITAKRAMDELANENLIARYRGKGSHVIYQYTPKPVQAPLVGMLENLIEMGKHSKVRVISIEQVVPPAAVRDALGIGADETVHRVVRVRSNEEGEPYAYYVSYTLGISKGFTKRNMERTPRLDVIRENGIELTKVEQTLSAVNASLPIAAELGVEPGVALLSILRRSFDASGRVVDVLDCLYNPKRFTYKMEMSID
ncbi:MAG: GntR family transcriptional regulator [Woeseiaceae bacterium]|nr:GntR family transcriptional regulator [Woeseiaceae bacterium]